MRLPPIIGLCGPAGAGKDTVADLICKRLRDSTQAAMVVAFAAPIRRMLAALPVPMQYMTQRELKERPVPIIEASYRELAQRLGTEWGRDIHLDFWVRVLAHTVSGLPADTITVIPDVRFENEADWIHDNGGVLIRIKRPGVAPVRNHVSEAEADRLVPDFHFTNTAPLAELPREVEALLAAIQLTRDVSVEA